MDLYIHNILLMFSFSVLLQDEFLQTLSDTVVNNRYIHMECVLRISPYHPQYMRGTIQFSLNFLEIRDALVEEG